MCEFVDRSPSRVSEIWRVVTRGTVFRYCNAKLLAQREERPADRVGRLRFEPSAASASAQSRVLRHPAGSRGSNPHVRPSRRFRVSLSLAQREERPADRVGRLRFESSVCSACVSSCRVSRRKAGLGSNPLGVLIPTCDQPYRIPGIPPVRMCRRRAVRLRIQPYLTPRNVFDPGAIRAECIWTLGRAPSAVPSGAVAVVPSVRTCASRCG